MDFYVGDRVAICGDRFPEQVGLIAEVMEDRGYGFGGLRYLVRYEESSRHHPYFMHTHHRLQTNSYDDEDMELLQSAREKPVMEEGSREYDDIFSSQDVYRRTLEG